MKAALKCIAVGLTAAVFAAGCERKVTNDITQIVTPNEVFYVGSDACQACHSAIHASFVKTGHPYKLNEAEDAQQAGYYPFSTVLVAPAIPGGWSGVDKVIGGFWWKARYINNEGRVYTGPQTQMNMRPGNPLGHEFVKYETDQPGFIDYNCGPCHMTGYKNVGNQEGKPGLIGTWEFNGIQCEECHGAGGAHVDDPYNVALTVDRSNALCGKCHIRGVVYEIPAKAGFIQHHEQWNEMFTTKHSGLQCVSCHDPHKGLHPFNPERTAAIRLRCENCHLKETDSFKNSIIEHYNASVACIDCHMPMAGKSATGNLATFTGDVHTHLWRINTNAAAAMFTPDGTKANGYLTLEYTCKRCHPSETVQDLAAAAGFIHGSATVQQIASRLE
ncbi:MAG: hypothetical protein HY770_06555 [Chitinivibrionia bacterium]|nr:hypothetical protein [Chitinivibrionia bacterium]